MKERWQEVEIEREEESKQVIKEVTQGKRAGERLRVIMRELGINEGTKVGDLPESLVETLKLKLEKEEVEGTIYGKKGHREREEEGLEKLIKIKAYRGKRWKNGYPVRGQRTKTNAKTAKKINGR